MKSSHPVVPSEETTYLPFMHDSMVLKPREQLFFLAFFSTHFVTLFRFKQPIPHINMVVLMLLSLTKATTEEKTNASTD